MAHQSHLGVAFRQWTPMGWGNSCSRIEHTPGQQNPDLATGDVRARSETAWGPKSAAIQSCRHNSHYESGRCWWADQADLKGWPRIAEAWSRSRDVCLLQTRMQQNSGLVHIISDGENRNAPEHMLEALHGYAGSDLLEPHSHVISTTERGQIENRF